MHIISNILLYCGIYISASTPPFPPFLLSPLKNVFPVFNWNVFIFQLLRINSLTFIINLILIILSLTHCVVVSNTHISQDKFSSVFPLSFTVSKSSSFDIVSRKNLNFLFPSRLELFLNNYDIIEESYNLIN